MCKRIYVFFMIFILVFVQYAGIPAQCLTANDSNIVPAFDLSLLSGINTSLGFVYKSSPVFKESEDITEENPQRHLPEEWLSFQQLMPWTIGRIPKQQGPFPSLRDIPADFPLPSSDNSDNKDNKHAMQEPSSQETPHSQVPSDPTGQGNESNSSSEVESEPDSLEQHPIDITPLVADLPKLDTNSKEYIDFENDMKAIVEKAVKVSGINTIFGVFIMDLDTELYYGVNENLTRTDEDYNVPEGWFNSASVIKLFQGYIFCDMLRKGELEEKKTYFDSVTGRKFEILPMLKKMISHSDNNYSNACLRIVDNKKSNEVLCRLGIKNSRLYGEMSGAIGYSRENNIKKYGTAKRCARITPRDTGLILYNIYLNKDTDKYMRTLNEGLLGNIYNTRIPVGVKRVSSAYKVAHKTGTNSSIGVYNDAGIVYTPTPFILVAFTQGTTSSIGHSFIRSLAEQLTIYFSNR